MRKVFIACLLASLLSPAAANARLSADAYLPNDKQVIEFADSVLAHAADYAWVVQHDVEQPLGSSTKLVFTMRGTDLVVVSRLRRNGFPDFVSVSGLINGARNFRIVFLRGSCLETKVHSVSCYSATPAEWSRLYRKAILILS